MLSRVSKKRELVQQVPDTQKREIGRARNFNFNLKTPPDSEMTSILAGAEKV